MTKDILKEIFQVKHLVSFLTIFLSQSAPFSFQNNIQHLVKLQL